MIPTRKVVLGSEKARVGWGRCSLSISKHSVASELQLAPERPALPRGRTTLPCTVRGSSPLFRLGTDDMAVLPRCGIGGGMFAVHNLKVQFKGVKTHHGALAGAVRPQLSDLSPS